ncbi:DUF6194 family protein [Microbacterium sp. SS28]|uniref:DUF6194 family protein n=1 Tax=Microbacterium sp. SS28 TaxID=2919948 RepID=UPI001FAB12AA|nr:DUF6194 family protein [Microbacterium sp. SS28]
MSMEAVLAQLRAYEGILELAPEAGGPFPEIAWGDHFFYYAPDGEVPAHAQPFATIVTKDYPDDAAAGLGGDRWRLNIHVGHRAFDELVGGLPEPVDFTEADAILPHPVYGSLGWVAVITPAERTGAAVRTLLESAYRDARARAERRAQHPST